MTSRVLPGGGVQSSRKGIMRGVETVLACFFQASHHGVTGAPGQEHTGSTPGCQSFLTGWQPNIFKSCALLYLSYIFN